MEGIAATTPAAERELLTAAQNGEERAFEALVTTYRPKLHAHCYRMLGSTHDAEDALQEATLRAWRAIGRFEGRSSVRSWLYTICTNVCLDQIAKRPKRVLPVDYAPAADPHEGPGEPVVEQIWIEPYPDEMLGLDDGLAGPEARYEERESIELAFVAALQFLPATQRAVLIMREVLGFSAKETAEALDTTVASANSALQRARATLEDKLPDRSQQSALGSLGDEKLREIVERYIDAWLRGDVDAVVGMLSADANFSMPPLATWFHGREEIETFLALSPMSGAWKWKVVPTFANGGQPALAFYTWDDGDGYYRRFALNVLDLDPSGEITDVTAFIARATPDPDREVILRTPDQPPDPVRMAAAFEAFGLPERLD